MKWWFGRKAGREGARPFLLRGWPVAAAAGETWPRSYEAQVREAFLGNPVAQRAVRLVAESVAWAPVYAIEGSGLPSPGAAPSGSAFRDGLVTPALMENVAAELLLHGNAFVQLLLDAEGAPAELFALRPERVSVEADAAGWPAAYIYKAGETKTRMPARDGLGRPSLVHLKAMHPLDDHKELFHNEALARIDAALHAAVEDAVTQSPPDLPVQGQCWIVAAGATGAWTGKEGTLACWTSGGWRFVSPVAGMMVWDKLEGHWIHWLGTGWSGGLPVASLTVGGGQVVGARQPAVPSPSGGTTIDSEARQAIARLTAALKTHGLID